MRFFGPLVDAHGSVIGLKSQKELVSMPLRGLAAATGGVAYFDRDDIEVAVREAIDDGRYGAPRRCRRGVGPMDCAQLQAHWHAAADKRPWRSAALVRHAAGGPVP